MGGMGNAGLQGVIGGRIPWEELSKGQIGAIMGVMSVTLGIVGVLLVIMLVRQPATARATQVLGWLVAIAMFGLSVTGVVALLVS